MGYRSQVAMCIEGDAVPALIAAHRMNQGYDAETHKECMSSLTVTSTGVYLHAGSWKWYDSHADVQWFESLWAEGDSMCNEGADLGGYFIRVGEDNDDVDERSFGEPNWDRVQFHRTIEVDFPTKENSNG